ncbi:MAG: hypothetical protein ABIS59_02520 [Candidatus Saccharibacteria bacterium]
MSREGEPGNGEESKEEALARAERLSQLLKEKQLADEKALTDGAGVNASEVDDRIIERFGTSEDGTSDDVINRLVEERYQLPLNSRIDSTDTEEDADDAQSRTVSDVDRAELAKKLVAERYNLTRGEQSKRKWPKP